MKYSILGFYQEEVLKCKATIDANGKEKVVCLDVTDLLILQCVADFMNRQCVYKYIINDKLYFSIQYKALLEDLPILHISKQALRDRIDKLVLFNLLEKEVIRNEQGSFVVFRIGTRYEQFVYNKTGVTVCSEVEGGVYQTTHGCVSNYTPKDSSTINSSTIKKEREDLSSLPKERLDYDEIKTKWREICPELSQPRMIDKKRKDAINTLLKNNNATIDDLYKAFEMISISSYCNAKHERNRTWKASFDWLIHDTKGCFNRLLEGQYAYTQSERDMAEKIKNGNYDIESATRNTYHPWGNNNIMWNDLYKCWLSIDDFDGKVIDGYTDENRPDGAEIVLHNARGTITWSKANRMWNKEMKSPWK